MTVTEDSFLAFVEGTDLVNADPCRLEALLIQIPIETNSYCGLDTEVKQDYAISLHIAHYLEIDSRNSKFNAVSGGYEVKRLESENDKIEFQIPKGDRYAWDKTEWGQRLQSFLDSCYEGGFSINLARSCC